MLRILQSSSLQLRRVCVVLPAVPQHQTLTILPELQPGDLVIDDFFTLFEAVGALEVRVVLEMRYYMTYRAN